MAIHYMKAEGGLHRHVWFAKAGRGTPRDLGIAPEAERHLENGTYSFSLAGFDPRGLSAKAATAAGKETSLYPGMGAQFGSQIWRMAHEAAPGDYIFLESENHNLHAIGVITGRYRGPGLDFNEATLAEEGIHAIPVRWTPIANGHGVIQLGRLDNAVFRDVMGKDDLMQVLLDLTQPYVSKGLYRPGEFDGAEAKRTWSIEPEEEPQPAPPPPVVTPDTFTTPIHVARNGEYLFEGISDARLTQLILDRGVLGTDHYFRHGMKQWMSVAQYAMMKGIQL